MSEPPRSFLGATKVQGEVETLITRIELEHAVSAGVSLRSLGNGIVPVYEEHAARLDKGINIETWSNMGRIEKALVIASRRVGNALQNIQTEAEISKMPKAR